MPVVAHKPVLSASSRPSADTTVTGPNNRKSTHAPTVTSKYGNHVTAGEYEVTHGSPVIHRTLDGPAPGRMQ